MIQTPEEIYGELFTTIQLAGIFPDSKTFVDCLPLAPVEDILSAYAKEKAVAEFSLEVFVQKYFKAPLVQPSLELPQNTSLEERLHKQWDILYRDADQSHYGSSLIPLPHPYIVPGGRFGEIYYWDSYFTMLGLKESGKTGLIASMVANFAHLIETVGHIPNGNRSYFISRSQPPFFAKMVELLAEVSGDEQLLVQYLPAMLKEYEFWMDPGNARVLDMDNGSRLNRYWDSLDSPRAESYREDVELEKEAEDNPEVLRHIRAACESGWDFSSRWLKDPLNLQSIEAGWIIPVDLNVLLWETERILAYALALASKEPEATRFRQKQEARMEAIQTYLWDAETGLFLDYHWQEQRSLHRPSLATLFPLWAGFASETQAKSVIAFTNRHFLKAGGLNTTLQHSGQQWDAPNGWAPLQWIGLVAFRNYGAKDLAVELAERWTKLNTSVFARTGKMMEKYNVEDLSLEAGGGEYPVQDGFGWTNAVYLAMKSFLRQHVDN